MRCSSLPLSSKCPGSYHLTGDHGSSIGRAGNAFHEAARAKVLEQPIDYESIRTRYGLTEEELTSIRYGIYNIQIAIPEGATVLADNEQLIGLDGKLTGTPDLGIFSLETLTVVDWKSGWSDVEDPETNAQLIGYAILMVEYLLKKGIAIPKRIVFLIVQPRINQVKAYECTREELEARRQDILDIIQKAENGKDKLVVGPHCNGCFKCMECPAFAGQVKSLANFFQEEAGQPDVVVEEALRRLLPFAKAVGIVSAKITNLAKAWVDANGPLELGGGQLYAKVIGTKNQINARKAFVTLQEYFSEDQVWKLLSISNDAITELARKTKRGLSTVVSNRLVEAGATTQETTVSYRILKGGSNDNGNGNEGTKGITDCEKA
jgi:hypothetical protein